MNKLNALILSGNNEHTKNLILKLKDNGCNSLYLNHTRKVKDYVIDADVDILLLTFRWWNQEIRDVLGMLKKPPKVVFLSEHKERMKDYLSNEFPLHLKEPYEDAA